MIASTPPGSPDPLVELATLPDADIRDAAPSQLDEIRQFLNNSLYAFNWIIFGHQDIIPSLHGDLCAYIELWGEPGYERIMTQISREFFKTSVGTRANALWQICREPLKPVAIFNERDTNSRKWLRSIRDIVSSSKEFQHIYRDLLPPGVAEGDTRSLPRWWKWSDEALDFEGKKPGEPEASISAHGIEAATTGGHWPKLILDDLISLKHKLSEAEMERAREWVRNHVYLMRPAENGLAYVNCTPWTYHDIYVDLIRDFNYRVYRRASLEKPDGTASVNGESIFPDKLSTEKLRGMYKRDPYTFRSQMQCHPAPGKEVSFDTANNRWGFANLQTDEPYFVIEAESYDPDIRHEEGHDPPPSRIHLNLMHIAGILDPAPSEEAEKKSNPNARNGLFIEGVDPWSRRFILEAIGIREDYRSIIDRMFALALKWGFNKWYIEEVVFSNVYRHWIADDQRPGRRYANRYMRAVPMKPGKKNKHARILDKNPGWRGGDYYINRDGCGDFTTEKDEYPNGLTIDLLDAMGYDHYIRPPESPGQKVLRLKRDRRLTYPHTTRDAVTGY